MLLVRNQEILFLITCLHDNKTNQVANCLNPVRGYRDKLAREGKHVKNHARENRLALKKAQEMNRHLREQRKDAGPKPFKLKKFENVSSRLQSSNKKTDVKTHAYLRRKKGSSNTKTENCPPSSGTSQRRRQGPESASASPEFL